MNREYQTPPPNPDPHSLDVHIIRKMSKSLKAGKYLIVVYMIYMKVHANSCLQELNVEKS